MTKDECKMSGCLLLAAKDSPFCEVMHHNAEMPGSSLNLGPGRKDDAGGNVINCRCGEAGLPNNATVHTTKTGSHSALLCNAACSHCGKFGHYAAFCPGEDGRKDDAGKLPYDLLPWGAVAQVVAVLQYGAGKYAPDNWRQVKDWRRRYFSAACRHLISWVTGEKLDPETGLHHLAHSCCCILFMVELDK